MVLGLGISAAVMTSSANADESSSLPKATPIVKSVETSSLPFAVLPSSIKAPSISGMPTGEDSDESGMTASSDEDSTDGPDGT